MIVKTGAQGSAGIAIGKAHLLKEERIYVEKKDIPRDKTKGEIKRFREAIARVERDLEKLKIKVLNVLGKQHANLIDVHRLILKDPLITKDVPRLIESKGITAESALSELMEKTSEDFNKIKDDFFHERKNDIFDVCKKIIGHLVRKKIISLKELSEPVVLIARNLYPSDTMQIKESGKVMGFCTDLGNKTSHTAIFAQSMGIPAVVGLSDITEQVMDGDTVIIDGEKGIVILSPDEETVKEYKRKRRDILKEEKFLLSLKKLPTATRDGKRVTLMVNIDTDDSVKSIREINSDGVGLFRTEMLYMNRDDFPTAGEQETVYRRFFKALQVPVIVRTADIGGDRAPQFILKEFKNERNPFMGLRGIRFFLKHPDLLKDQLRAIYRANVNGAAKIMLPMVSNMDEIISFKEINRECKNELLREKVNPRNLEADIGVMIEIPSSAMILDIMLGEIDFVSIGTNDLVQYVLAVDRINQGVSRLYDHYHPAVLRLINLIVQTSHKKGKTVSVCGEMATEPLAAALLVGLGVDVLSVPVKMYLRIKHAIRAISFEEVSALSQKIIGMGTSGEARETLQKEIVF